MPIRSPRDFFLAQKRLLEDLFGPAWLGAQDDEGTKHPAVRRWSYCNRVLQDKGLIEIPRDLPWLPEIAQLLLDSIAIVDCTKGSAEDLSFGALANYGDERVQRRIKAVIGDPDQYRDVMTELTYASWHLSKGHGVIASENPGLADFRVRVPGPSTLIIADCKRLKPGSPRRLRDAISGANKQIKNYGEPAVGLAVVDISERVPNPPIFSDRIPFLVLDAARDAARNLGNFNSSISGVILIWNDYCVREIPGPRHRLFVMSRRQSWLVPNPRPKISLPEDKEIFLPGYTVTYDVDLHPQARF